MTHRPLTLAKANAIVSEFHRHNRPVVGHRFSIAAYDGDQLVGVAIVGRPIARAEDQENDVEILRVCTVPGAPKNTCSYLYAACRRIWQTWGGKTIRTTTLESESGSSLRGSGFVPVKRLRPRSGWDTPSRRRKPGTVDGVAKVKWEGALRTPEPPQPTPPEAHAEAGEPKRYVWNRAERAEAANVRLVAALEKCVPCLEDWVRTTVDGARAALAEARKEKV